MLISQLIQKIYAFILDMLFPIFCVGCRKEGTWLCGACEKSIPGRSKKSCSICNIPQDNDFSLCKNCKETYVLSGIIITHSYKTKIMEQLIHLLKYKYIKDIQSYVGNLMVREIILQSKNNPLLKRCIRTPDNVILIPVPLHKKKFNERGYNQSELIARELSSTFGWNLQSPIKRVRDTKPQARLSKEKREDNLKGAFALEKKFDAHGQVILLIDDVLTTGSTLNECAKCLTPVRPKSIIGLVIAKNN